MLSGNFHRTVSISSKRCERRNIGRSDCLPDLGCSSAGDKNRICAMHLANIIGINRASERASIEGDRLHVNLLDTKA